MLLDRVVTRLDVRTCSARGRRRWNADAAVGFHDGGTDRYGFAVADGIGDNEPAARVAAVAATVAARAVARLDPAENASVRAVLAARAAVCAQGPGDAVLVVATALPAGGYSVAWAGDCRAYLWDGGTLAQLTTDQTVAEYLRSRGESAASKLDHVVTNSVRLGTPRNIGHVSTTAPGRLVLTTDGVHRNLGHDELTRLVGGTGDSRAVATALVLAGLHNGGTDNATALVVSP